MFQHMLQKILADLYHCIFTNTILDLANSNEFTRLQLYEIMNDSGQTNYTDKLSFLSEYVRNLVKPSDDDVVEFEREMDDFIRGFKSRWIRSSRTHSRFVITYTNWLNSKISFNSRMSKRGRKELSFEECGVAAKLKKHNL